MERSLIHNLWLNCRQQQTPAGRSRLVKAGNNIQRRTASSPQPSPPEEESPAAAPEAAWFWKKVIFDKYFALNYLQNDFLRRAGVRASFILAE